MKTKVRVEVVARDYVHIEVEHDEGDDPCDLTPEEINKVQNQAFFDNPMDYEIVDVQADE